MDSTEPTLYSIDETFPDDPRIVKSTTFNGCHFKGGVANILQSFDPHFCDCHFYAGSTVNFGNNCRTVRFVECRFEEGAIVNLGGNCQLFNLYLCYLPSGVRVFNGNVWQTVSFFRRSLDEPILFLPSSPKLYLGNGQTQGPNWEITKPFPIPHRVEVSFHDNKKLRTRLSLEILTFMCWRNSHFHVSLWSMDWAGDMDLYEGFKDLWKNPLRGEISPIVVLLCAKCIPPDLIRGELVPLLM